MSQDGLRESYEATPYAAGAHWESHPDSLAAAGALLGVDSPDIRSARVLEIGCATGGNILPMATALPEARFLGIDLSPRQIEMARRVADALGLSNVDLRPMDLLDFPRDAGAFDYIICHGVYCWVPEPVRAGILDLCARHLSPSGLAFISINTCPGWQLRGIARDMMAFHTACFEEPQQKISEARRIMSLAAAAVKERDTVFARLIAEEAKDVLEQLDYYVLHEHLDGINRPLYFHQFQRQLEQAGLTYLSESPPSSSAWGRHGAGIQAALDQLPSDPLAREQYLDFFSNRVFRRSIVCHGRALPERRLRPQSLVRLHFSGMIQATEPDADPADSSTRRFEAAGGKTLTTNNPVLKGVLLALSHAWPNTVDFAAIQRAAGVAEEAAVCGIMLELVLSGVINAHRGAAALAGGISERPRAFEYARAQAADGVDVVTNARHRGVVLEGIDSAVLALLDGDRSVARIVASLEQQILAGEIDVGGGQDPCQRQAALTSYVHGALRRLHRAALLTA